MISNLVSNAIKFTQSGSIRIVTRLNYVSPTAGNSVWQPGEDVIMPTKESSTASRNTNKTLVEQAGSSSDVEKGLSADLDVEKGLKSLMKGHEEDRQVVVRVEIHDSGAGLKKEDLVE